MPDIPENVDWGWIARNLIENREDMRVLREDMRSLRTDMDILIRSVIRLDHTVEALREDVKSLWLSQGDLRRRIEALEEARRL